MERERPPIGVNVRIACEPPQAERLLSALEDLQHATRREAGNLKFDILQSPDHPGAFLLIEEFEDEAAVAAHRASSHYQRFKQATASLALAIERYVSVSTTAAVDG